MIPGRGWLAILAVAAIVAAACGSTVTETSGTPGAGADVPCTPLDELPGGDVANAPAADTFARFAFEASDPIVAEGFDHTQIISGGPPPDGIRPIDAPCFDDVAVANQWLEDQSPVMVVEVDEDARAYPLAIMTQHEIANDVIAGEPIVVTYCPLCNSGLAFERTVDGEVLDFGTSGRLFQSNLVMYDRQTRSLWSQFTGQAVVAADEDGYVETVLERLPTAVVSWSDFRDAHPDGLVLSPGSEPGRDYGRNPYVDYDGSSNAFLFRGPSDDRLPGNARVVGIGDEDEAVAVWLELLRAEQVTEVTFKDRPLVVFWTPGQASALDTSDIDEGQDVGSTGVFVPEADGQALTFEAEGDTFVDAETGSTWNVLGQAVDGPLAGTELESVARDDTFWFVWFAFRPHTTVAG